MADLGAEAFAAMGYQLFAVTSEGPQTLDGREVEMSPFLEDLNERALEASSADEIEAAIWEEDGAGYEAHAIDLRDGRTIAVRSLGQEFEARRDLLQRANDQSLERGRLLKEVQKKEMLLRCIVHDLGNPLATVIMNLQRAERLIEDERARWSVNTALEQAVRQRGMIRSVIDVFSAELASLEEFDFDPANAPDLVETAQSIVAAHSESAADVGVRLDFDEARDLGESKVCAEGALLERVIENLIANAVRHAGAGTTVTVRVRPAEGGIELIVDDQGLGIPAGMENAVFEPHVQVGPAPGQAGLGLFFCKRSVERWGGAIGCANRETGGARFWFRLLRAESS
jgi:signal transduction histidine kinase